MLLIDLIPKFESYLKNEKGATHKTIRRYIYSLRKLLRDMKLVKMSDFNEDNINQNLIYKFWDQLENGQELSSPAKSNYIAVIKNFNKFLVLKKYMSNDFSETLSFPKPKQVFKDGFSEEEQIKLREYFFRNLTTERGRRDSALFLFLLGTGARIDEVLNLKCKNNIIYDHSTGKALGDFEVYDGYFYAKILGKGNKERQIAVDPLSIAYITKHLKDRNFKSDIIFNSIKNNRSERILLTVAGANKILKHVMKKAGINRNLTTHSFRHTWAVNMLNNSKDLDSTMNTKKIMAQGGWSNEASLEAYYKRDRGLVKEFAGKNSIFKHIPTTKKQSELEKLMINSI